MAFSFFEHVLVLKHFFFVRKYWEKTTKRVTQAKAISRKFLLKPQKNLTELPCHQGNNVRMLELNLKIDEES